MSQTTLRQAYEAAYGRPHSKKAQEEDSRAFDLSCLFQRAFGISRYQLPLVGEQLADLEKLSLFQNLCARYEAGEPLQYILGEWEFFGLPFYVGPGVLIPRPDTEILVEKALELLAGTQTPRIADLCAGTGCVGISLAAHRPQAQVYALELSPLAFSYLERNIQRNQVSVTPLLGDALIPLELPPLDLVVSNPPYISKEEMEQLDPLVKQEPELALYGGEDGYRFYQRLPSLYFPLLKPGGAMAFEVGYRQANHVKAFMEAAGFQRVGIQKDLAGIDRVVFGSKPE